MNQIVDILCRARELYAAAPSHMPPPLPPGPGRLCLVYAVRDAVTGARVPDAIDYVTVTGTLKDAADTNDLAGWNAEHSTQEVLAAFDRAIAAQRLIVPALQHADPVHAGQES